MGTLGDISSLILQAYRLWQERSAGTTITPQQMFDKFVNPSYQLLKGIHGDYADVYLELRERISFDDSLSEQTVRWFSRARVRREADRSELRLLEIPKLTAQAERARNVDTACTEYLALVAAYFEPAQPIHPALRERIKHRLSSASSYTAARLHALQYWPRLSPASQRVFGAEEFLESSEFPPVREVLIERLLEAANGTLKADVAAYFATVANEAELKFHSLSPSMQDDIRQGKYSWGIVGFDWKSVLDEHIRAQLSRFSSSLSDVQKAYFRVRILTDRQ